MKDKQRRAMFAKMNSQRASAMRPTIISNIRNDHGPLPKPYITQSKGKFYVNYENDPYGKYNRVVQVEFDSKKDARSYIKNYFT